MIPRFVLNSKFSWFVGSKLVIIDSAELALYKIPPLAPSGPGAHWLVSVKFDSHLVSGSLFFQGVHKNIFEIV